MASIIGADPKEIVFTSGATESNNISVKGVARFYKNRKRHLITTQVEHKCVLGTHTHRVLLIGAIDCPKHQQEERKGGGVTKTVGGLLNRLLVPLYSPVFRIGV